MSRACAGTGGTGGILVGMGPTVEAGGGGGAAAAEGGGGAAAAGASAFGASAAFGAPAKNTSKMVGYGCHSFYVTTTRLDIRFNIQLCACDSVQGVGKVVTWVSEVPKLTSIWVRVGCGMSHA